MKGAALMRRVFLCAVLSLLLHTTLLAQGTKEQIKIVLKHDNDAREMQTKSQLQKLLAQYDLSRFIFTKEIIIDREAIPHSHPVLTLHTRHLKDDELFLSTFVHEQIHWFFTQHQDQTEQAVKELRTISRKCRSVSPKGPIVKTPLTCTCWLTHWNTALIKNCSVSCARGK